MKKSFISHWFMFICVLLCVSCGAGGTDTGNPSAIDSGTGDSPTSDCDSCSPAISLTGIEQIVTSVCEKLVSCSSTLTQANCEAGVFAQSNIDTEIGLPINTYSDLEAVLEAELDDVLTYNSTELSSCLTSIDQLSCQSSNVTLAYRASAPSNFTNVYQLIPVSSCSQVY